MREYIFSSFNLIFGNILFSLLKKHKCQLRGHSKSTSFEKEGREVDEKSDKKNWVGRDAAKK